MNPKVRECLYMAIVFLGIVAITIVLAVSK